MSFEGTIVNGTVVFNEPPGLAEGTRVDVQPKPAPENEPTLLGLLALSGTAKDLPADFADEHDHYIHGTPRRAEGGSMRTVFADSFYFFALNNDRDSRHTQAVEFLKTYAGRMWTTNWVLSELGDGLCRPENRRSFLLTVETLRKNPSVTIEPWGEKLFDAGIDLFSKRPDKEWSLTDCISFVVMEREGITEALTGDHHFEQAGFTTLLR